MNPPATIPDQDETQDPIFESPTSPISELDSGLISVPSSFQTDSHAAHAADPTPSKPKLFDFSFIRPGYITDGKREPLEHPANLTSPAWHYGVPLVDDSDNRYWLCKHCVLEGVPYSSKVIKVATTSVSAAVRHLNTVYLIQIREKGFDLDQYLREKLCLDVNNAEHVRIIQAILKSLDKGRIQAALARWIVCERLPF